MGKKFKDAPIKVWEKAKEIRLNVYKDVAEAKDKGKLVVGGGTEALIVLPCGFDHAYFGGEPYGASVSFLSRENPGLYQQIVESCEYAGYPRDLCAYMRNYIGSMLVNKYAFGGPFPKLDFCLQGDFCDTHGKWYQIVSEIKGYPYFVIDMVPYQWDSEGESEKSKRLKIDYMVNQIHDAIEWMEKVSGRKFDDEKFIQGVKNEFESTSLWAQICLLNRAIPAPLDEKSMFSFYILAVLARPKKEVVDFYRELLDETKYRVENQIAANPYERFRVISDSQPPWYALEIFRLLEHYGVVSLGAHYSFGLSGGWEYREEEDTWNPAKTPPERGIELKTRDEAARALAEWWLATGTICRAVRHSGKGKNKRILDIVDKWHVNGVIIHLNRGCEGMAAGQMEVAYALSKAGIPVLTYEGNHADPREYDEARTFARVEAFMETLSLEKVF